MAAPLPAGDGTPVEDRFFDNVTAFQVLDDDALEKLRGHPGIPDRIRIHDDDGAARANSETWGFPALDPARAEEKPFPMEQGREERVQFHPSAVR